MVTIGTLVVLSVQALDEIHAMEEIAISLASDRGRLSIWFSVFLAVLPIVGVYASGVPGLAVADALLVFFTLMCVVSSARLQARPIPFELLFLGMYTVGSTLASLLLQGYSQQLTDIAVRTVRYLFYIVCIVHTSRRLFNFEVARMWVVRLSILATAFILFQYVMYYSSGLIVKGFLPFMPLYESHYADLDYQRDFAMMYRPSSFFLEPAWYSQYALVGLCLALFDDRKATARQILVGVLITVGIFFSTSLQGILLSGFVWLCWIGRGFVSGRRDGSRRLSTTVVASLAILATAICVSRTSLVQRSIARLQLGGSEYTSALWGRLAGLGSIRHLDGPFLLIGLGNGAVTGSYMSSAAYALYGTGIIGLILIAFLFAGCYCRCRSSATRCICVIWMALFIGAFLFQTQISVFYFSFILYETVRSGRMREPWPTRRSVD